MDPAWVAVAVSAASLVLGPLMSYAAARRGTEVALARQEERHNALAARVEEDRSTAASTKERHEKRLGAHELSIGLINQRVFGDRPPPQPTQPLDFVR